jgi:hypothetical protein
MPVSEMQFVRTDADGRFDLSMSIPIRFAFVRAAAGPNPDAPNPTIAAAEVGPFAYDPKVGLDGLELILGNGGSIEGRVLLPEGRDTTGLIVGVSRGDGYPRTMKVGADGAYRFAHLTPGRYAVAILGDTTDWTRSAGLGEPSGVDELPYQCAVDADRKTTFDLDLSAGVDVVLLGRVALGSKSWEGFEVRASAAEQKASDVKTTVTADGRYRLALPNGGRWTLSFANSNDPGHLELRLSIDVAAMGETQTQYSPVTGAIRGTVKGVPSPSATKVQYWRSVPGEPYLSGVVIPAADGSFAIDPLPVGAVRLTLEGADGKPIQERKVDLTAGAATEATFP